METQQDINYDRIAAAIGYIREHFKEQPGLEEIAAHVHLSPYHFQRMFTDWAGVSPKKFLQYISLEHAKGILQEHSATLFDAAWETGLSGTGRLHDLFVSVEGMTPGEYKNGGAALVINYSFAESPFGDIIIASTAKGICYMAFTEDASTALPQLVQLFPNATYRQMTDRMQQNALRIFSQEWTDREEVKLHLKGTDFQLKVWETLLKIPSGLVTTYGNIAQHIKQPTASRAVGSAVGDNPVAFLIPCHRVIKSGGETGEYHWGTIRKTAILGWEAAIADQKNG